MASWRTEIAATCGSTFTPQQAALEPAKCSDYNTTFPLREMYSTCREDRLSLALARPVCPRDHSQRPNLSVQARFRVRLGYYPRRAHYYSLAAATCSSRLTLTLRFPAGKLKSPLPFPRPDRPNHTRFHLKRRDQIMLAPTAPPYP